MKNTDSTSTTSFLARLHLPIFGPRHPRLRKLRTIWTISSMLIGSSIAVSDGAIDEQGKIFESQPHTLDVQFNEDIGA
jgi:hypothetical protein